ncbi:MAG: nucleoside 2-deoxyribosyltransferase domain-containing protein [Ghiorsea sp.]
MSSASNSMQLIQAYRIIKDISTEWIDWDAYHLGLIDKTGKKIHAAKTPAEKKSLGYMTILAMNIKRLLQKLPIGNSKALTLAAVLYMLKEETSQVTVDTIIEHFDISIEQPRLSECVDCSYVLLDGEVIRNITLTDDTFYGHPVFTGHNVMKSEYVHFIEEQLTMEETSKKSQKKKVFLGGTCNDSKWRNRIMSYLASADLNYFDPVVDDWNEKAAANELVERVNCDFCLYTITAKMTGVYSIAEVVDDSNKRPNKTVFVVLNNDGNDTFTKGQTKSLNAVSQMVERNGGKSFDNLKSAAKWMGEQ